MTQPRYDHLSASRGFPQNLSRPNQDWRPIIGNAAGSVGLGLLTWAVAGLAAWEPAFALSTAFLGWPVGMAIVLSGTLPGVSSATDRLCERDDEPDQFVAVTHAPIDRRPMVWFWVAVMVVVVAMTSLAIFGAFNGWRHQCAGAILVASLSFGLQRVARRTRQRHCLAGRDGIADTSGRFVSWSHVTIHRREQRLSMVLSATGVLDGEWLITAEAGEHQLQRRRAFFFRPRPQWSAHTLELLEKQGGAPSLSPSTYRRTPGRSMDELCELAMDHEVALHLRRAAALQVGALGTCDHRHALRAHARSLVEMRVRDALEAGLAAGQATRRGVHPVEELDAQR